MVVRNHSPKLSFMRTALVALSYRCSMTRARLTPTGADLGLLAGGGGLSQS